MKRLVDPAFAKSPFRYIWQAALATASIFVALTLADAVEDTVSIASLGASSFIAFTMPTRRLSKPKLLVGGYMIGTLTGAASYYLGGGSGGNTAAFTPLTRSVFGALAVGSAIFLMVILDTEHPPAAGLALGYVVNGFTPAKAAAVMLGIVLVALLKRVLKPVMIDLI